MYIQLFTGFRPWRYVPRVKHELAIIPEYPSSPSDLSWFVWLLFIDCCVLFWRPLCKGCPFLVAIYDISVHWSTTSYYPFNIFKLFVFSYACASMIFVYICALFERSFLVWLSFYLCVWLEYDMPVCRITGSNYPVDISKSMYLIPRHDMQFMKRYWKLCW